jgi:hypothetical protein
MKKLFFSLLLGTMSVANVFSQCVDELLICKTCACPEIYAPVIGCNGVKYSNSCEAKNAGVLFFTDYIVTPVDCSIVSTPCIDTAGIKRDLMCPMVYLPVVGCDGVTYGNACEAARAGVVSYKPLVVQLPKDSVVPPVDKCINPDYV